MTVHVTTLTGDDLNATEDPALRIWITGRADLLKLQALLNRALNTAPEFGADWFALSDRLNQFIADNNIR